MTMMIIPIIFIIILLMLFIFFLIVSSRQDKVYKTMDKDGKVKQEKPLHELAQENKSETKSSSSVASSSKEDLYKKEDVFKFMEFDKIMDSMIVQNGGSRFTMAIQCKGINYDLMSDVERLSVEEGFITFLNTLKYPIQLYVQAQNVDLKGNVAKYKQNIEDLTADYNEITEQYNKIASSFDVDERELDRITKERDKVTNVYEYAHDIIKYVEKMSTNKNLLQRKFFILLSYNTSEINAADKFNKDEIIDMCYTELSTRCKGIISALSSCSVSGKMLTSSELADLLYSAYNRDDKTLMSVREAVDAGMLRLYSTSEDAFKKREEQLEEYLRTQAKLRAYKAVKYAKEHDSIVTPASEILNEEEEISRRATNYIKNSDFDEGEKEIAQAKILADYREDKKTLQDINEIQKESILEKADKDIAKIPELEKVEAPEGVKLIEKSKRMIVDPVTGEVTEKTNVSEENIESSNNEIVGNNTQSIDESTDKSSENSQQQIVSDFNLNKPITNVINDNQNISVNIQEDDTIVSTPPTIDETNNTKKTTLYDDDEDESIV